MDRKNLKEFNKIRVIAQTIKNKGFKREYDNIVKSVLVKSKALTDDELGKYTKEAIKKINSISKTYQYIPNKSKDKADFTDHQKLFNIEQLTKDIIYNRQ